MLTAAGESIEATVAGRDGSTDLALLKLSRPPAHAPAPPATPQQPPRAGQLVLVVGRAPESGTQASMGILSAVSGPWRTWRGGKLDAYLRLDTTTYPGTSGSLVIDSEGLTIGMATAGLSRLAPLAVPASTIARVVSRLLTHGHVGRGFLGVGLQPIPLPPSFGIQQSTALIILTVEPDSPAHKAGLIAGDILVSLDGHADERSQRRSGCARAGPHWPRGGGASSPRRAGAAGGSEHRRTEVNGEIVERVRRSTVQGGRRQTSKRRALAAGRCCHGGACAQTRRRPDGPARAAGETIEATVAGRDGSTDLALLKLSRPPAHAPALPAIRRSRRVRNMSNQLVELSDQIAGAVERAAQHVVTVQVETPGDRLAPGPA